jgi:hypothetical protein
MVLSKKRATTFRLAVIVLVVKEPAPQMNAKLKEEHTMRNTASRAIRKGRRSIFVVLLSAAVALSVLVAGATAAPKATSKKEKSKVSTATKYSPEQAAAISEWAHSLAVQAGTFAAPIVGMYNLRQTVATGPSSPSRIRSTGIRLAATMI